MEINGYGNRHFTGKMVAEDGPVILLFSGRVQQLIVNSRPFYGLLGCTGIHMLCVSSKHAHILVVVIDKIDVFDQ